MLYGMGKWYMVDCKSELYIKNFYKFSHNNTSTPISYIYITMTFLARQNKLQSPNPYPQQPPNRAFGRGLYGQLDHAKAEQKMTQQQVYKQQLQRQIMEKEARKKAEQDKIRREDEKFMREVQEEQRKEMERKAAEKEKQKKLEEGHASPPQPPKKDNNTGKTGRTNGNLNISTRQPQPQYQQQTQNSYIPKLPFDLPPNMAYQPLDPTYLSQKKRSYTYEDSEQVGAYYEQRIRRHKEQLNMKLDELFHHINSTKDNIRADEEIEKIRRRLRAKQMPVYGNQSGLGGGGAGESRVELEYENKFFSIPKKNNQVYSTSYKGPTNQSRSRVLDYQSSSKFSVYKNGQPQTKPKIRTQHDDMYKLPEQLDEGEKGGAEKWGRKPGKDNFLSNREAIDYEAESILGRIDDFLGKLKT